MIKDIKDTIRSIASLSRNGTKFLDDIVVYEAIENKIKLQIALSKVIREEIEVVEDIDNVIASLNREERLDDELKASLIKTAESRRKELEK